MHKRVKDAFEEIDAVVMNGDMSENPEDLKEMRKYVERWRRRIGDIEHDDPGKDRDVW